MKMKVLSPAGDMESLKMAVFNGADEVYLGVKDFNARNIEGFSLKTLKDAVDFAHIYNVRVFLAVNILFSNEELQSALDLIIDAYNLGVDAFILQDIGLISIISKNFPQIEIHASTQMGVHNLEGVKELEKLNIRRVVLARETPIEEIKRINENSNIEIEYFVHGALCVSFSGNCYLSSYLFDASGNRGKCKQLCRLPYELQLDNKTLASGYLLSAKDNNMLSKLKDLSLSGVDSLKIEGRARRPYYVGEITRVYRNAVDGVEYNSNIDLAFNRGFTEGYFNGNGDIISNIQNHIGVEVGTVTKFVKGKKFNEIEFSSNREISAKSTLKFFKKGVEIATVSAYDLKLINNSYKITTTQEVEVGSKVNLIADASLETEMLKYKSKRKIQVFIKAVENEKLYIKSIVNEKVVEFFGDVCEPAKSKPLTIDELQLNFNKNEYFDVDIKAEIGNVFILKQNLNEFRRNFFVQLINSIIQVNRQPLKSIKIKHKTSYPLTDYEVVENLKFSNKNITIYSPETYVLEDIKNFISICEQSGTKPALNLPNFALKKDIETLKEIVEKTKITIVVNNLYALSFDTEKIIGGGMNVYNSYSSGYFKLPYLNAEGENNFKMPYMTLRHCPMKQHLKANCANCPYKQGYQYKMQNGKILKLKRTKLSSCTFTLTD